MEKINLRQAKLTGVIGSALSIVGSILAIFSLSIRGINVSILVILFVAAIVFTLIAIRGVSQKTKAQKIFSSYLIGFILFVVGIILYTIPLREHITSLILSEIISIIFLAIIIVSAYYTKQSFDIISVALNKRYFKVLGILLFLGTVTVVNAAYNFVTLIRAILELFAFLGMPNEFEMSP
jgi:uncharacterized membrane protein